MSQKKHCEVVEGWWFCPADRRLGYRDDRVAQAGAVHALTIEGEPVLRRRGLHASKRVLDALRYAPGTHVARVELHNPVCGKRKMVASKRRYLWIANAEPVLRSFARWCALQVIDKWDDAPEVVKEWLETGDEQLRSAAESAAEAAAGAAAEFAARSAADAAEEAAAGPAEAAAEAAAWCAEAYAAWSAAEAAAWSAAESAVDAARFAAEAAARDAGEAAVERQNAKLEEMLKFAYQTNQEEGLGNAGSFQNAPV